MARVLIRGCGDVGSAVAHRLLRDGHEVVIHDVALPAAPRRGMALADAVFDGACELDGVRARRAELAELGEGRRAEVLVSTAEEIGDVLAALLPDVLVDARMRKRAQPATQRGLAPLTIGLGPNFVAGETTDLAIETQWGDDLGTVVAHGPTKPLGGEPRSFAGHARDRFVYAPRGGVLRTRAAIAQRVVAGQTVATIGDEPLRAPLDGILRGLVHDGVAVAAGAKVVEVDPRGDLTKVFGIGPRPRRIAEGVVAAMRRGRAPD
ncbi:MAG: xanthine dehydrogenase accessory factor [Solirubrobacteraceae bacterium]|nr:xanthine dehydrogenase accessory factor [Solirubrobacteraceae bacterium]